MWQNSPISLTYIPRAENIKYELTVHPDDSIKKTSSDIYDLPFHISRTFCMNHTIRSVYWLVFVELPSTKLVPIRRRIQVRGRRLFTSESSPKRNQIKINRPRQQPRFSAPYDILNTVCLTVPSPWVANSKPARRCETAQRCNANMVLTKSGGEVNNKQVRACRQQVVHLGPVIVIFAELRLALWEKFCDLMKGQTDNPLATLLSSRHFGQTTLTLSTELKTWESVSQIQQILKSQRELLHRRLIHVLNHPMIVRGPQLWQWHYRAGNDERRAQKEEGDRWKPWHWHHKAHAPPLSSLNRPENR